MCTSDPLLVDRNVPAAVSTVLEELLRCHLNESSAAHKRFASDIGERVVTFTVKGGRRRRSQLLWWSMRACGGGPLNRRRLADRGCRGTDSDVCPDP